MSHLTGFKITVESVPVHHPDPKPETLCQFLPGDKADFPRLTRPCGCYLSPLSGRKQLVCPGAVCFPRCCKGVCRG